MRIGPSEILAEITHVATTGEDTIPTVPSHIDGYSGARVLALLRRLTERITDEQDAYVEIGVYRGLTLSTVARVTDGLCIGIDDFSLFNPSGDNRSRVESVLEEFGLDHVVLLDSDAEIALESFAERFPGRRIGVLFVDGGHDYRSQLVALLLGREHLADGAVIVIDDANYRHVRQATEDFLRAFPEFALAAQMATPAHPANLAVEQEEAARSGWWNGVQVLVHDPDRAILRASLPRADQHRFRQSHDAFRHLLADRVHEVLRAVVALADGGTGEQLDALVRQERARPGRFEHQNVDPADGPEVWIADQV